MRPGQELLTVIRARAAGTPYVVTGTCDGFAVRLGVDDPRWFEHLRATGLTGVSTHHVRTVESERRLLITEERQGLRWTSDAGGHERPTLAPAGDHEGPEQPRLDPGGTTAIGLGLVVEAADVLGWTIRRSLRETLASSWRRRGAPRSQTSPARAWLI